MADADRGPDHGRLDRLTHTLREVDGELSGEQSEGVRTALEHVRSYRETVEGSERRRSVLLCRFRCECVGRFAGRAAQRA